MLGRGQETPEIASQHPVALPVTIQRLTEEPWREPVAVAHYPDRTREPLQAVPRVLTLTEQRERVFAEALAESPWSGTPAVRSVAWCESELQSDAVGDQGRARGYLQVRRDAHPDLAARFDLDSPSGNLAAGWIVFVRQGWGAWDYCARKVGLLP